MFAPKFQRQLLIVEDLFLGMIYRRIRRAQQTPRVIAY
jgi:hypothetical protein